MVGCYVVVCYFLFMIIMLTYFGYDHWEKIGQSWQLQKGYSPGTEPWTFIYSKAGVLTTEPTCSPFNLQSVKWWIHPIPWFFMYVILFGSGVSFASQVQQSNCNFNPWLMNSKLNLHQLYLQLSYLHQKENQPYLSRSTYQTLQTLLPVVHAFPQLVQSGTVILWWSCYISWEITAFFHAFHLCRKLLVNMNRFCYH